MDSSSQANSKNFSVLFAVLNKKKIVHVFKDGNDLLAASFRVIVQPVLHIGEELTDLLLLWQAS